MERQIKNLAILPVDKWIMGVWGKLRVGNYCLWQAKQLDYIKNFSSSHISWLIKVQYTLC